MQRETIASSTSSTRLVVRLVDHVAWIDRGRIVAEGALMEMVSRFDFAQENGGEAGAMIEGVVLLK